MKGVSQLEIMGMAITKTVVVNGDKCWIKVNDMVVDLPDKVMESVKQGIYVEKIAGLVFLQDKGLKSPPSAR